LLLLMRLQVVVVLQLRRRDPVFDKVSHPQSGEVAAAGLLRRQRLLAVCGQCTVRQHVGEGE
jgi:hypothetical protein